MFDVNRKPTGTAKSAFEGAKYSSAGKTGTVQVRGTHGKKYDESKLEKKFWDNALYAGYAPYENPQVVIAVVAENAGSGGAIAAPIARKMFDEYFKNVVLDQQADTLSSTSLLDNNE